MAKIRCVSAPWYSGFHILIEDSPGQVVTSMIVDTVAEGAVIEPSMKIDYEAAQGLMDDMWSCGLRPSDGTGSQGQLKATERHLEDMRKLVFMVKE